MYLEQYSRVLLGFRVPQCQDLKLRIYGFTLKARELSSTLVAHSRALLHKLASTLCSPN